MPAAASPRLPRDGDRLQFSVDAAVDEYLLLEVTDEQLADITQQRTAHCFEFRGAPDSEAVLVSGNKTYGVRLVETSNTALLLDDATGGVIDGWRVEGQSKAEQTGAAVRGQVTRHFELSEVQPAVCHLRSLLLRSGLYGGALSSDAAGTSSDESHSLHTFDSLRRLIQASDEQLRAQLHSVGAYDVSGHYRLLHSDYSHSLLHDTLNAVVETKQPRHRVHLDTVAATVQHLHPPAMTRQCLHILSPYSAHLSSDDEYASLCPQRVSQHVAHSLFSADPPGSHWQRADRLLLDINAHLPPPLACQPAHLLGIAVALPAASTASTTAATTAASAGAANSASTPAALLTAAYHYVPSRALPVDVSARLSAMFAVKEAWSGAEMAAWMVDVTGGAVASGKSNKADSAWLKHCRAVADKDSDGNKCTFYTSNARR